MSLIIGIECTDGIVIGADSAATFGTAGRNTIRQSARKLHVINERAIIACAGHAGLAQRYHGRLHELLELELDGKRITDSAGYRIAALLHEEFHHQTKDHIASLISAKEFFGLAHGREGLSGTIVALPSRSSLSLIYLDDFCNAELATTDLPFVSLGSGQFIADPFLAFLKRVLWEDRQPSLSKGVLSTIWTLEHAIQTNPGGVGGTLHVATIELKNERPHIKQLTEDEISTHRTQIKDLEKAIAQVALQQEEDESPAPPGLKTT